MQSVLPMYNAQSGKIYAYDDLSWYTKKVTRTRGAISNDVSSLVIGQESPSLPVFNSKNPFYAFDMSNMTILTDGTVSNSTYFLMQKQLLTTCYSAEVHVVCS